MKKKTITLFAACMLAAPIWAQSWPEARPEAKPGARWWWLGSAVNKQDLQWNMQQYSQAGIGSLEITPIYGVQGNARNELSFLSAPWMDALKFTEEEGRRDGILIDMNCGTGWPFGGPNVPIEEAACKLGLKTEDIEGKGSVSLALDEKEMRFSKLSRVMLYPISGTTLGQPVCLFGPTVPQADKIRKRVSFSQTDNTLTFKLKKGERYRVYALYDSRTRQQVKRAAPGGEGYVIDHFDRDAVAHYLARFDSAFVASQTPWPHNFFNDSYEVYGADWTPSLLTEFEKRRGYRLEDHLPELLEGDDTKVLVDYRETLGELLLENFTNQWTSWAHSHGVQTRNQAHGSPANLIDQYAAVDIPEIEGFGLSDFGIRGLRTDSGFTRKNDSDVSMLKYASSAAHITGKPLTSSETFTWLTEHFRTSLSQMKPDIDLMFTCGVNHMFFHGTTYSPKDDPWPGWKFYASVDMSPTNSIWRDAPYLMKYIERSQSFLQMGQPDNDFLVYLPVRDMWAQRTDKNLLMQFDIHSMAKKAPDFISSILDIDAAGYDCDYISDRYLLTTTFERGMLQTAAGTRYRAIIIPGSGNLPENVKQHLLSLQAMGATVIMGTNADDMAQAARPEPMRLKGLRAIRRQNKEGHHYFIANLTPNDVQQMIPLSVRFRSAVLFNPMNGDIREATTRGDSVLISLRSGESVILQTFTSRPTNQVAATPSPSAAPQTLALNGPWKLAFTESSPAVSETFSLQRLQPWEQLANDTLRTLMGTGVYTTHLKLSKKEASRHWEIDLGDVRESARVYINNVNIGCAWAVPFVLDCKDALKTGDNVIRIEVTNLPANRISEMDRQGIAWRKFNEINIVDINYKKTGYENWKPVPSGLNSTVVLRERP
jgi:hypothetical protein